jgi:hypothetical protein
MRGSIFTGTDVTQEQLSIEAMLLVPLITKGIPKGEVPVIRLNNLSSFFFVDDTNQFRGSLLIGFNSIPVGVVSTFPRCCILSLQLGEFQVSSVQGNKTESNSEVILNLSVLVLMGQTLVELLLSVDIDYLPLSLFLEVLDTLLC